MGALAECFRDPGAFASSAAASGALAPRLRDGDGAFASASFAASSSSLWPAKLLHRRIVLLLDSFSPWLHSSISSPSASKMSFKNEELREGNCPDQIIRHPFCP